MKGLLQSKKMKKKKRTMFDDVILIWTTTWEFGVTVFDVTEVSQLLIQDRKIRVIVKLWNASLNYLILILFAYIHLFVNGSTISRQKVMKTYIYT